MKAIKNRLTKGTGNIIIAVVLAAIFMAAAGTTTIAKAQATAPVAAPLYPGLNWNKLGRTDQTLTINSETMTLSGTLFQANEKYQNLEQAPADFFEYYSSTSLANLGWIEITTTTTEFGASTLYFNQGVFALVEFKVCDDTANAMTCINIWQSVRTKLVATPQAVGTTDSPTKATTFSKKSPADLSTDLKIPEIKISWSTYTGSNFNRYRYCIDESDNGTCDASGVWTNAWGNTSVTVKTLTANKTYYWQVQAVMNDKTKKDANSGDYWQFSTVSFKKTSPASEATGEPLNLILKWQSNPYSNPNGYKYCISLATVTCTSWVSTTLTSVTLKNLALNTKYQWQVKAVNTSNKTIDADNGTWFKFSTIANRPLFDFDGNGKGDFTVFRPSDNNWYIYGKSPILYGQTGDIPVPRDYNKDGKTELAIFRRSNGTWYISGLADVKYGTAKDIPVPADYNGDGKIDIAFFRPATGSWYIKGKTPVTHGQAGDIPVPADYNGDGKADLAVFRPSENKWYIYGTATPIQYGVAGDILVPGDYNGDGKADIAAFRPSVSRWLIRGQSNIVYGQSGDIPVPGDYNGDGKIEIAVFRPTDGTWYVRGRSTTVVNGAAGDQPIALYYYTTP